MKLFEVYLLPTSDREFQAVASRSRTDGTAISFLPFWEGDKDRRLTLIKTLELSDGFVSKVFSSEGEMEWMVKEELLASDRQSFAPDYLEKIGQALYQSLFPSNSSLRSAFETMLRFAENEEVELHLRLKFDANSAKRSRLADYPWELLHDGERFLLHRTVVMSRHISYEALAPRLPSYKRLLPHKKLQVLFISSQAQDPSRGLEKVPQTEQDAIIRGLDKLQKNGKLFLQQLPGTNVTLKSLSTYLTNCKPEEQPQIIHFNGHGLYGKRCQNPNCQEITSSIQAKRCKKCNQILPEEPEGFLLFEDEIGNPDYISAREFAAVLLPKGVVLVFLSACESGMAVGGESIFNGTAQQLIDARIPAVVAMQYSVRVGAAEGFTEQFYRVLGNQQPLVVAVREGRKWMMKWVNQWFRPILFMRWFDDVGGSLFEGQKSADTDDSQERIKSATANLQGQTNKVSEPLRISLSKLPSPPLQFVGRDSDIAKLDQAWKDSSTKVFAIVAFGGVGKTALIRSWLDQMEQDNFCGAKHVFGWSFPNQGISVDSKSEASADEFISEALRWFGDKDPSDGSHWQKGQRLADRISESRTLLLLDGLEPLQYEPTASMMESGLIKDPALATLIKALTLKNPGLCVITSRIPIADIEKDVHYNLNQLSDDAGASLLQSLGVRGDISELRDASSEVSGHCLTLNLLGRYLVRAFGGDILKRDRVELWKADRRQGGIAKRVISMYEGWLGEGASLQIVNLVGLFNRPVERSTLRVLQQLPEISGISEYIVNLNEEDWNWSLSEAIECGLITFSESEVLDAHPIVRQYFRQRLSTELHDSWELAHSRLFDHYSRLPSQEAPETLAEMDPLFQAITHGCLANRHLEAFENIYWSRISRGELSFCAHFLGAAATELTVLSSFFLVPWQKLREGFDKRSSVLIFHQTGYDLRAVGRLRESIKPMSCGLKLSIQAQDWMNAARSSNNLARIHLMLGQIDESIKFAMQAVEYADTSKDSFRSLAYRSNLAYSLHQRGEFEESKKLHLLVVEDSANLPSPHSVRSNQYWDFLLDHHEYLTVKEQAEESIAKEGGRILDVALDYLSLGQARLLEWDVHGEESSHWESKEFIRVTEEILEKALLTIYQAGRQNEVLRGLLVQASFYRQIGRHQDAFKNLNGAFNLATRYNMKLHVIDCHLEYAKLCATDMSLGDFQKHLEAARSLIKETGYERRINQLNEIFELHPKRCD